MSTHSPRLQFVTRHPNAPKTEVKGFVLVEGPWFETLGSPGLPFDLDQSLMFPGLFQLDGACTSLGYLYFDLPILFELFVGRHKGGRSVSWVKKGRLDLIRRLLEITEMECNHELLLSMKYLQELGANYFPYIVLVVPCPLPEEIIKGKIFILVDLLKSIPGSSSQVGTAQEPQVEFAQEALATFVQPIPLPVQDPKLAPYAIKKKKGKKGKKVGQVKATSAGLEGFVDWVNLGLVTSQATRARLEKSSARAQLVS